MTSIHETEPVGLGKANYASALVNAAMARGGPLHVAVHDLISEAEGIAQRAVGLEGNDPGAEWPMDHDHVVEEVTEAIASALFRAALAYARSLEAVHA